MKQIQTTEDVCAALEEEAKTRGGQMALAAVTERAELYNAMTFEARGMSEFVAATNRDDQLDLVDMVLDAVESQHGLEFNPHRDGGGQQTIHWSHA